MGQPIAVVEKPSATPGVVRYEVNRSLTGMGHARFASREAATGATPAAELARRLFDTGKVASVHVYANVVTVDLCKGSSTEGLLEVVENLFIHYRPGVVPTPV